MVTIASFKAGFFSFPVLKTKKRVVLEICNLEEISRLRCLYKELTTKGFLLKERSIMLSGLLIDFVLICDIFVVSLQHIVSLVIETFVP